MKRLAPFAAGLLACSALGCAVPDRSVTRVVDGREVQGRYVSVPAYSAYLRGTYLEAHGDPTRAQAAYERALEQDPESVHVRARLGALLCTVHPERARAYFQQAEAIDPSYPPLWYERGRCLAKRGKLAPAQAALQRAMQLDPLHLDTSVALATVQHRQGQPAAARRQLAALIARYPNSRRAWQAQRDLARRQKNATATRIAERELARLDAAAAERLLAPPHRRATLADVDAALVDADLDRARELARRAQLGAGQLAVRAAATGRGKLARDQAALVLAADPNDGDAWAAALVSADLLRDEAAFASAVAALGARPLVPGPLGARLLAEVLRRRLGDDAARAWLTAYGPLPAPSDPLERSVAVRGDTRTEQ